MSVTPRLTRRAWARHDWRASCFSNIRFVLRNADIIPADSNCLASTRTCSGEDFGGWRDVIKAYSMHAGCRVRSIVWHDDLQRDESSKRRSVWKGQGLSAGQAGQCQQHNKKASLSFSVSLPVRPHNGGWQSEIWSDASIDAWMNGWIGWQILRQAGLASCEAAALFDSVGWGWCTQ